MACLFSLFALMALLGQVSAKSCDPKTGTCDAPTSNEESILLQSQYTAEVKAHYGTERCSHLAESIKKEASKKKVDCMGGHQKNGELYCEIGSEQQCPGSNETCGGTTGNSCCTNPCPGVQPYPNATNFPCPSAAPTYDGCESNEKVENCLDPCATPSPTAEPTPAPQPTPSPTAWVCTEDDLKNPPMLKGTQMGCSTGAMCYGEKLGNCSSAATCYATKTLDTCNSAHCCAGRHISTCTNGSICYAKTIGTCEYGAKCKEEPTWTM